MTKIWIIKEPFARRDRRGALYVKRTFCVERDELTLVGLDLSSVKTGKSFHLRPSSAALFRALALSPGVVAYPDLYQYLWPNPEDEPECADSCMKVALCYLRKVLKQLGYTVYSFYTMGYRLDRTTAASQGAGAIGERSPALVLEAPAHAP